MIEHRCSRREALAISASLFQNGHFLDSGTIRNVNQNGVFLEAETTAAKNTFIEVVFNIPDNEFPKEHRFFAMVAHSSSSGLGLYVDVLVPESRHGLHALMEYINSGKSEGRVRKPS
ncbi:MAG: hypothetical protein H6970_03855 [Gammaproteobacteria bacterium]|nr:hypothetical protein [Gammaproteobacteria bacterium]MCP5424185.1 hypothetical protein [Gammaproteobacteria bacterium]MCP5458938.1 hypothetical protein [Gammaproteobacteria bacterium]